MSNEQPKECRNLNCFTHTFEVWFVHLQERTETILEIDDERWRTAYRNGTTPCTALTDAGLTIDK